MADRYEVLVLTVPELTQDESKQIENEIDKLTNKAKGMVLSFERWGKYRLTYPMRANDYGVYFLVRFESPKESTLLKDLQDLFRVKLHDIVMRHMVTRLDGEQSLEYQRPKSLEESPTSRDMNTFLKENKMEGLLSSVDKTDRAKKTKQPEVVAEDVVVKETVESEDAPVKQ